MLTFRADLVEAIVAAHGGVDLVAAKRVRTAAVAFGMAKKAQLRLEAAEHGKATLTAAEELSWLDRLAKFEGQCDAALEKLGLIQRETPAGKDEGEAGQGGMLNAWKAKGTNGQPEDQPAAQEVPQKAPVPEASSAPPKPSTVTSWTPPDRTTDEWKRFAKDFPGLSIVAECGRPGQEVSERGWQVVKHQYPAIAAALEPLVVVKVDEGTQRERKRQAERQEEMERQAQQAPPARWPVSSSSGIGF